MRFELKRGEGLHPQVDEGIEKPWRVEVAQNERLPYRLASIFHPEGGHKQEDLGMRNTSKV
jgi:hypothetical protein